MRSWADSVLIRGIRWRLMGSVLIVITAAIAVGTAIIGPLYLRAGDDSLVRQAVAAAPLYNTDFELSPAAGRSLTVGSLRADEANLLARGGLSALYGSPVETINIGLDLKSTGGSPYAGALVYRSGICAALHFSTGGCQHGVGDTVLSTRTARKLGLHVGSRFPVSGINGQAPVTLHVTGIFTVPNLTAPYWFGEGGPYFPFGASTGPPRYLTELDDLFVASPAALGVPASYRPSLTVQSPLRHGALGTANASSVRHQVQAAVTRASETGLTVQSNLPALLSATFHQQSLMTTIVAVAAVQLVLLAIWVLTSILLRNTDLRRAELRVARLRGFPPRTLLAVSVTEPAALCAIGGVVGILAAWGVVRVAASALFASGTTVAPDAWTVIGLAAVLVTSGAVLGLSALRLLRGSELTTAAPRAATQRSRAMVDVAILVVAAVELVAASTSGALSSHSNPVAAASPAVVALGTSVIAIRLVELACRRLARATLDGRAVASFLAVRRVGRRPAALREGRTLVIAVGLACFAVSAWSVARANRLTAASFAVGARTVVTVTADDRRLTQAVARVDPHGRFAMAAVEITNTQLIGVDASRLAAVAAWPGGTTAQSLAAVSHALNPGMPRAITLATGALALTAHVSVTGVSARDRAHLRLSAWESDPDGGSRIVDLGALATGSAQYRAAAQSRCPCRLVGIGVLSSAQTVSSAGQVHLQVASLGRVSWRSTTDGVSVQSGSSGVTVQVPMAAVAADAGVYESQSPAMASVADHPLVLPAVAGSAAESLALAGGQEGTLAEQGLDGTTIHVRPVIAASSLPRVGRRGVLVDLSLLERTQLGPAAAAQATQQVWLGPRAPADAVARLRGAGLSIDGVQRSAQLISQGDHTGPALAYDFMLIATLVAILVAAVGTFGVLAAGSRGRASELMGLEVAGVGRPILVRSLAIEAAILAGTALFGVLAGVASAAIALPSLPQLASGSSAPLSYALPAPLILAVAAGTLLVVAVATGLAARGILSRMSPSLLRAAADDVD